MFIFFLQVSVSLLHDTQATDYSRSCCPLGRGTNYRASHIPSALIYNQAKIALAEEECKWVGAVSSGLASALRNLSADMNIIPYRGFIFQMLN